LAQRHIIQTQDSERCLPTDIDYIYLEISSKSSD
jgi:hypothetical protein